jgi:adenosylcobyric acid synthase
MSYRPGRVNSLAQSFAAKALQDGDYQQQSRKNCRLLRQQLVADLQEIPALKIYPSTANFLFIELLQGNSTDFYNYCKQHSVLIRRCDNYQGLDNPEKFVRIAVRTAQENNKVVELFRDHFSPENISKSIKQPKKARSLMFQGTCSDAGKSILTAGLCRILFQDGFKVAPFKAQNMSLNSFVTSHGEEMGRAQVVQAQAARLDPDSRMNPILLKPNSDTGSQIIVSGKPVGNMTVNEYGCYKTEAWKAVCRSYDSLAEEFELIVLEGAGSPGEVNLKHDDIVNMRMAQYAGSPVLLVGDIDRGGVYSSFVGIMEVLAEWERNLVAGYIVNKFRGQASLLESAHRYVTQHTGREVLGVVPYLSNLGLPEEDSVSFKKGSFNTKNDAEGVEIALINLPHISNFTDVEPFLEEPDVSLRVIDSCEQLASPGAIILPGSKNVIHDLQFLIDGGFIEAIRNCHKNGAEVVGICGGYQMIGTMIRDPWKIESGSGEIRGLGLLELETVLEKEKHLTRKNGIHCGSGKTISGYEIHHGISTDTDRDRALLIFDDGSYCGRSDQQGSIWGSYLHGIFDSDDFRRWFIDRLRMKNNLQPIGRVVAPYDLEPAFDRLAEALRQNLDLDKVYNLLGI